MTRLTWRRIDAPGGGLQAYYRGKWRLEVWKVPGDSLGMPWRWACVRWFEDHDYRWEAGGSTKRQRDAKHMAACALEMMEGER